MKLPWNNPNSDKVLFVLMVEETEQYKRFFNLYQYIWPKFIPIDYMKVENYFSYWVDEIWDLIDNVCAETPYDTDDFIEAYHARYGC